MAVTFSSATLLLIFLHLLAATTTTTAVSNPAHEELETALQSLRSHGYRLFTNAIVCSEIQFQLLYPTTTTTDSAAPQFTLFAPRDGPIYELDMRADAEHYVSTLRYHVIPNRRLTFSDLRNLSSPLLSTLLPHFSILIRTTLEGGTEPIVGVLVNGARISNPDLFIGPNIAVHGINGILSSGFSLQHEDEDSVDDSQTGSGHSDLSNTTATAPISEDAPVETSPIGGEQTANNKAPAPPINQEVPVKKSPASRQRNADRKRRKRHAQAQRRRKQHRGNHEL